jgi:hypothetical protein
MRSDVGGERSRVVVVVAVALAALPAIAAAVSVFGRDWYASGDQALELLRITDVGGRHTPLVGAWSRWGWSHPGPLLFWALAPFELSSGEAGVLVGTGLLNALAAAGATLVGYRRGGAQLALLVAFVEALLARSLGLDLLVDPWNPWAAFLPFVLFLLLVWSVLCDDFVLLPVAVGVGSFSVQTHAGYLPLVGGLLVIAVAWTASGPLRARRHAAGSHGATSSSSTSDRQVVDVRRYLGVSALVGLLTWSAPLIQQITSKSGNLGNLISYARTPSEPPVGWALSFGVMGEQLRLAGPWITGHDDPNIYGLSKTASTIPALVWVAVLVACVWWSRRQGSHDSARLAVVALVVLGLGLVATARTTPNSFVPYVLRWWWAIPAIATLAVMWTALSLCPVRVRRPAALATLLALVVTVAISLAELPAGVPGPDQSRAMAALADPTAGALDRDHRYLVRGVDERTFRAATSALYLELYQRGFHVFSDHRRHAERSYGSWRLTTPDDVDEVVTIVNVAEIGGSWRPPEDGRRVAVWDPLTGAQRARARELEESIRADMGEYAPVRRVLLDSAYSRDVAVAVGAEPEEVAELHDLQQLGDGYAVYVSPTARSRGASRSST